MAGLPDRDEVSGEYVSALDPEEVSLFMSVESLTLRDVGYQYFTTHPADQPLFVWLSDVANGVPERRWAVLELVASYALSFTRELIIESDSIMDDAERDAFLETFNSTSPFAAEYIRAAQDVLDYLESPSDPASGLPPDWQYYLSCRTSTYATAASVFAMLGFEAVRIMADDEELQPDELWGMWLSHLDNEVVA